MKYPEMKFAIKAKEIYLYILQRMILKYADNPNNHSNYEHYRRLFISEINQYIRNHN